MKSLRHLTLLIATLTACWFANTERAEAACVPVPYGAGGIGVDFVQFWPSDGNAYDVLGTNHGVLRNGATYAAGKVGQAFSFGGVNDFVELADDNDYVAGTNRFTIEFWVRFASVEAGTLDAPGTIFVGNVEGPGNRDKWFFGHGGGQLFFHVNTSAGPPRNLAQAPFNPATNQWIHLAVIRGFASTYKIYINGVESSSEVDTNAIPATIAPLTLGQAGNTGFLDGQLDEVTLYAFSLTVEELQSIVNAGADGKCRECEPPPSGLTDWWPGNNNALDVQGPKSGTLIGGTSFANGYVGEAFKFDGIDDAVTTQRDLPFDTFSSMTWECWVLPERINFGRQQIVSIDDGGFDFSLLVEGNSYAVFTGSQSWLPPNSAVTPLRWDHLAVVFSPANVEFYLNGIRTSFGSPAVYGGSGSRLNIGRNPVFGEYFKGMIDEVSIYNRALTHAEILELYGSRHSGKCRNPAAGPRIEVSPAALEFGPTSIGETNERLLVVQNTGGATLSASLAASNSVFGIGSPGASFTVPAGGSQPVKVRFTPTAATRSTGTLTITHDDPSRPPILVDLGGTGEPPSVCLPTPSGLVSWWRAEDFSAEDARGPNHGVPMNGASFAAGKVGSGFNFDGVDSYVEAPTGAMKVGASDFAVEGWIRADPGSVTGTGTIISFGGAFAGPTVYLSDNEGRLNMWPLTAAPVGTGFRDGQFHHFAVVRQGTGAEAVKYYKDGALIGTAGAGYDLTANQCFIGWDKNPGHAFLGIIDELSFYNRALSPSEVNALFAARGAGKCFDPLTNAPEISATPATLVFDTVIVGATATQNLTVSNSGVTPLTVSAGAFDNTRFSVAAGTFSFSVAAGTNKMIAVQFSPTDATPQSGTLTLTNNDLDEGSFQVPLSGVGKLCPDLPSGAVSWWRAEDNALDSFGSNSGALAGDATYGPGFVERAFSLDGSGDHVVVPSNGLKFRTGDFTAEGWVKTTSTKGYNAIFTFDSYNPAIYILSNGTLQLYPSGPSSGNGFNDGLFHHFAVVRKTGTVTYYKDGVDAGTAPSSTDINPTFTGIGTSTHGAEYFPGLIDELTFYNRALTSAEVAAIAALGNRGKCADPLANPPDIAVTPTSVDFGSVSVGSDSTMDLTVNNVGVTALTVSSGAMTNPLFSVAPDTFPLTVDPGVNKVIPIKFSPTAAGDQSGTLTLASNDPDEASLPVALTGLGQACPGLPTGAVSWWRAEDTAQDSIGPHHGQLLNGAKFAPGFVGQGFFFDGNDDRVNVPIEGLKFRTGNFTAEGWIKTTSRRQWNAIFTFNSYAPAIYVKDTGKLQLYPSPGESTATGFNDGVFHHFAVVREGATVRYYKDGVAAGTSTSTTDINPTFAAIGTSTALEENFSGVIDELTLYNRALTAAEVAGIAGLGSGGKCGSGPGATGANIKVTPVAPDFGFVGPGQSSDVTLTLTNEGTAPVVINNFLLNNPRFTLVSPATNSLTLAPDATQPVTLRFTPAAQGLEVGFLALENNSAHGTFYLPLRGIAATASRPRGGIVYGWGNSSDGQLASIEMDNTTPFPLINGALAGKTIMAISSSVAHTLALDLDGRVLAWGAGGGGQLGDGTDVPFTKTPVAVSVSGALAGKTVAGVAAGNGHSVALTTDGRVYTWGDHLFGQLGNGQAADSNVPVAVKMDGALAGKRVTAIAAGGGFTLALASDGKVYSWGADSVGGLGDGATDTPSNVPVAVNTTGVLNAKP